MEFEFEKIRVGGVYVSSFRGIARKVLAIDRWGVEYTAYVLASGAELMTSRCSMYYFSNWAEREATPSEYAKLDSAEGDRPPDATCSVRDSHALTLALRTWRRKYGTYEDNR